MPSPAGPQHRRDHSHGADHAVEMIDLETEALGDLTGMVIQWAAGVVATPPRHLVDLGSGTGAGTCALLKYFPGATVTAIDSSPQMLARVEQRAAERDQSERLAVIRGDLDDGLPPVGDPDLVWASSAMHHLSDPDRLLSHVGERLADDGWFVIVEAEDVPWFLPEDLGFGRPGLERRCHQLLSAYRAAQLPHLGSDWGARLTTAGLVVRAARTFELEAPPPLPTPTRRFARGLFSSLREAARDRLAPEDVAALDVLLDDTDRRGLARRDDLNLRATQKAWAAQRPLERKDAS